MTDRPLFVHYHLPKTGGQTLRTALVHHLTPGATVVHLGMWAEQMGHAPYDNQGIADLSPELRDRIRVITGHRVDADTLRYFEGRDRWEFTMLRDPADRMISHYNFDQAMRQRHGDGIQDFETWYAERGVNPVCRYLAHRFQIPYRDSDRLIARVDELQFLGDTATLDAWLPQLMLLMELPPEFPPRVNVTGIHHPRLLEIDDALRERIESDHPRDAELFRHATADLFAASLVRLRQSISEITDQEGM